MSAHTEHITQQFQKADNLLRVHGLLSIIFGSLGVLAGLLFLLLIGIGSAASLRLEDTIGAFAFGIFVFVLFILPHIYLIIAGAYMMKQPTPKLARVLVIINLVLGVFWNFVLLVFAIINLVQIDEYERAYPKRKS
jgi:hypothetical protein